MNCFNLLPIILYYGEEKEKLMCDSFNLGLLVSSLFGLIKIYTELVFVSFEKETAILTIKTELKIRLYIPSNICFIDSRVQISLRFIQFQLQSRSSTQIALFFNS